MRYNKIRGNSVAECMMKLRSHHGTDAIILEQREIKDGGMWGLGLFSKKHYEIDFMIPENTSSPALSWSQKKSLGQKPSPLAKKKTISTQLSTAENAILHKFMNSTQGEKEKATVLAIADSHARANFLQTPPVETKEVIPSNGIAELKKKLEEQDFSPAFIANFLSNLEIKLSLEDKNDLELLWKKAKKELASYIAVKPYQGPKQGRQRAFFLLGPTGVGKTTSLAKLAARFAMIENRKVSIYSLDQYRLAATEQLKTYTEIMGIDFFAPKTSDELAESLLRDGSEVLLMDSSGLTYGDTSRLEELRNWKEVCQRQLDLEITLVLSANTNPRLLKNLLSSYEDIGFDSIALSKLDETEFFGAFIEIADIYKRPFCFLTNGQEVPSDLQDAEIERILSRVLS